MALFNEVANQAWIVNQWLNGRSQIDIARELGVSGPPICTAITRFCFRYARRHVAIPPHSSRERVAALGFDAFIDAGGKPQKPVRYAPTNDAWTRYERVGLMRAEGMTYDEIGAVMDVSKERVRQMLCRFGRRMNRAMQHTKWRVVQCDGETANRPVESQLLEIERSASATYEDLGQGAWVDAKESSRRMWRELASATISMDDEIVASAHRTIIDIDNRITDLISEARRRYAKQGYELHVGPRRFGEKARARMKVDAGAGARIVDERWAKP